MELSTIVVSSVCILGSCLHHSFIPNTTFENRDPCAVGDAIPALEAVESQFSDQCEIAAPGA